MDQVSATRIVLADLPSSFTFPILRFLSSVYDKEIIEHAQRHTRPVTVVAVTVAGVLAGLAAALLASRALASFLYGTSTHDPLVLITSTLILAVVSSAASLAPAVRAARIDLLTAIRTE